MSNREYTNKRPAMNDADIDQFKDFDSILDKLGQTPPEGAGNAEPAKFDFKQFLKYSKNIFIAIASIGAVIAGLNWFMTKEDTRAVDTIEAVEEVPVNIPAIRPPIPGAEKPFSIYTIDAQKDEVITTPDGSKIYVKKNTFLDDNGAVIKGKVDVQFREYHNVIDIFKSGIPMEYDSAGRSYTFESAGMFELKAKQGDREIQSFDKDIEVDVVSENASTKFNDYYYDTSMGNWTYIGKSSIVKTQEVKEVEQAEIIEQPVAVSNLSVANTSAIPPQQPVAPMSPEYPPLLSSKYAFEVEYDRSRFTEIYGKSVFQVDETQSAFSPVYYKINWDRVELSRSEIQGRYSLHLEKGDKKLDVVCFPVLTKEESTRLRAEYDASNKAYQDSLAVWNRWVASQPVVSNGNDHMITKTETYLMKKLTFRRMSVPLPGTYNCDHPIYAQRYLGDKVNATFTNGDTAVTSLRNYVVEVDKNALFAARNGEEIILSKNKNLIAWVWTKDHTIGIVNRVQLKTYKRVQKFDMTIYPAKEGMEVIENMLKS